MTTPYTDMLALYRACPIGLIEGEAYGNELLAAPERLASLFMLSAAQFARYANPGEPFHRGAMAPPFEPHHGQKLEQTVDVARRLSDGCFESAPGADVPGFRYLDRELDVMRTSTGQLLDDGSPAKRALVLDLLLAATDDGRPILVEVKICEDTHAIYALVQALAAAVHLVTPAQRKRLGTIYGGAGLTIPRRPPYADIGVLLIGPQKGKRIKILATAKTLASALEQSAAFGCLIGGIHFLQGTDDGHGSIELDRA